MTRKVRILETTIRDGGYMFNHHYSRSDLAIIVGGLARAGFQLLEVGHGAGVGSELWQPAIRPKVMPQVGDDGHIAAIAAAAGTNAKVGVIFTGGARFTPVEYLDKIASLGFAFVRLAFMPDEFDDLATKYVAHAKQLGMTVAVNLMQTYAKTPAEVGDIAKRAADHGVDWFYVVDSAGGLPADEVKRYVTAVLERANVEVGLHAHNNLGCAVANALAAVEAGATLVDTTLNGIGRATGNPPTEQMAIALQTRGHDMGLDLEALLGLGNAVRSLFEEPANDPMDVVSGGSLLHSRNVPEVIRAAKARKRSAPSYLLEVGRAVREKGILAAMSYPSELYDACAEKVAGAREAEPLAAVTAVVKQEILGRWTGGTAQAFEDLLLRKNQHHKPSALHISRDAARFVERPVPWEDALVGATVARGDEALAAPAASRVPDYLIIDEGDQPPFAPAVATFRLPFTEIYARAAQDLAVSLRALGAELACARGSEDAAKKLLGTISCPTASARPQGALALVAAGEDAPLELLGAGDYLLLLEPWSAARVRAAHATGAKVVRPQWRQAVARVVSSLVAVRQEVEAARTDTPLVSDIVAPAADQVVWAREHATLLQAGDATRGATLAAEDYSLAVWRGLRRF